MSEIKLSPSIFAADITALGKTINILEQNNVQLLHIDVMDGSFVNRMAYGADHIKMIKNYTQIPLDVHMMVMQPERHLKDIIDAGADIITIHEESTSCLYYCLQTIKNSGRKCAVALSPATNPSSIEYVMNLLDMVLIMTVNPGEGRQKFIPDMVEKIKTVKKMVGNRNIDIEVDGSIDNETAVYCCKAGANVLVSGGYMFNGDITKNIVILRQSLKILYQG